ncbi:MAG: hypothetical protein WBK55_01995 [Alphaproteobacteria bacterium]
MTNSGITSKPERLAELRATIEADLGKPRSWVIHEESPGANSSRVTEFSKITGNIEKFHTLCLELKDPEHLNTMNRFRKLASEQRHGYAVPIIDLLLAGRKPVRTTAFARTVVRAPYLSPPDAQPS